MITLQSGEIDKIIVTGTTPTPPNPPDPVDPPNPPDPPDPEEEEEVGVISIIYSAMDGSNIGERNFPIKRNMLGTSVEISPDADIEIADIVNFIVSPSNIQVTQINSTTLSVQIPTELLEEKFIKLIIFLAIYGR